MNSTDTIEDSQTTTPMTTERLTVPTMNTLRDIYLEIPSSISKYLMEAGITSFLNCIEIQKQLVLTCHYILHKIDSIFDEGRETISEETNKVHQKIVEILKNDYLKKETINFEENQEITGKILRGVERVFEKDSSSFLKMKPIFKFLNDKGNVGMVESMSARLLGGESTARTRADVDNEKFRKYYNLGGFNIINEAEDIATHLMNEVNYFS
jgi:hypothetical protein